MHSLQASAQPIEVCWIGYLSMVAVSLSRMVRLTRMMVLCLHKVSEMPAFIRIAHIMPVFILSIGVVRHWLCAL